MGEPKILGVQQAREQLRDRIDAALEHGEHTVVTRAGRPVVVVVPFRWYANQAELAVHHIDGNPYNNTPANLTLVPIERNSQEDQN